MNMFNLLIIFLFIPSLVFAQSDTEKNECEELVSELSSVMNAQTSQSSLSKISEQNPDLLIIGEYHHDHLFWQMNLVYDYFKNLIPRVNCIYSEFRQDGTEEEIQEAIAGITNDLFGSIYSGYGPLYKHVHDQNDSIVLVDATRPEVYKQRGEDVSAWLTRRDSFMISRIKSSLETSECSAGIYNVGAQHLRDIIFLEEHLAYSSFGRRIKSEVDTIVIGKGADQRLNKCESHGVKSFIAPASNQIVRDFFKLDEMKSTADYVLYLRKTDKIHALTQ